MMPSLARIPRLELTEIVAGYGDNSSKGPVLKGLSLTLRPGTSTAVMGSSGSGKTTLLNCAAGLMIPDSGSIHLDGAALTSLGRKELDKVRRERFGFIYQEYNLIEALNVLQNVQLPTYFTSEKIGRSKAMEALVAVNLEEFAQRKPDQLSGGQRQRVAIARALAVPRQVIFADEPTGALDRRNGQIVIEQLVALTKLGTSLVLVTHDPIVAAAADQVIFLSDGQIADQSAGGDPFEISRTFTRLGTLA